MLQIQDMLIKYNYSKRTSVIKYIVIHTTGNTSKGAGVKNHFNYFNGGNRNASADYFVDDSNIARFVKDINYAWHCGDGSGKYGITNNNSLGIELCVNSDGNFKKTIDNAIDLVKYLMNKYNIGIDNVVQHYDASRKNCPKELREGKEGITWSVFKQRLINNSDELYRVRKSWSDAESQIGAFKNLESAKELADKNPGYNVFNSKGENVYPIDNILYRVVVGTFANRDNANAQIAKLKNSGFDSFLMTYENKFRVICGTFSNKDNAIERQNKLKVAGFNSFIAAYNA